MSRDLDGRVRELLKGLGLRDALAALGDVLPKDLSERRAVLDGVDRLLRVEADRRRERRIVRRGDEAHLPDRPTLETFDFAFQPKLDKALILDLATLAWVDRYEDLLLLGQSGTGKSHIAKALCLRACAREMRVLYTTCATMMATLHAALADGSLERKLKRYTKPQLLLVDDLGYDPLEQEHAREAQLLHKVLEGRLGKTSTIITSNLPISEWAAYLGHHALTVAILDKFLFRATALTIDGPSFRLAAHKKKNAARRSGAPDAPASPTT